MAQPLLLLLLPPRPASHIYLSLPPLVPGHPAPCIRKPPLARHAGCPGCHALNPQGTRRTCTDRMASIALCCGSRRSETTTTRSPGLIISRRFSSCSGRGGSVGLRGRGRGVGGAGSQAAGLLCAQWQATSCPAAGQQDAAPGMPVPAGGGRGNSAVLHCLMGTHPCSHPLPPLLLPPGPLPPHPPSPTPSPPPALSHSHLEGARHVLLRVQGDVEAEGHHAPPQVHALPHLARLYAEEGLRQRQL